MKKAIIAVALTSIITGAAQAATVYEGDNGDNVKVYGGAEVGGTFVSDTDKSPFENKKVNKSTYVDDSFATIGLKGQTGDFYAKFELDAERQDWTTENNMRIVIDKAYVGYNIAKGHSVEFGRTDTAYDHVDAFGDVTNELGLGISEAGDQDSTLKYRGTFNNIKVGISHSLEGWDGTTDEFGHPEKYSYETDSLYGQVTNGYIGYYGETFTVIAGAEEGDETSIYSLHGEVELGKITIAGLVFDETKNFDKGADTTEKGVNLGGKYAMTEKLNLLANVNYSDSDAFSEEAYFGVVGAEYRYARNVKLAAEVAFGDVLKGSRDANGKKTTESGALGYLMAYYWF